MKRLASASPRTRAEDFVTAWIESDYQPDEIDPELPSETSIEALIARVEDLFRRQAMRPPCQGTESYGTIERSRGLVSIGTPQKASSEVEDEPDLRCPECPAYSLCLSHVLGKGWSNWTCRGCDGPGSAQGKTRGR